MFTLKSSQLHGMVEAFRDSHERTKKHVVTPIEAERAYRFSVLCDVLLKHMPHDKELVELNAEEATALVRLARG